MSAALGKSTADKAASALEKAALGLRLDASDAASLFACDDLFALGRAALTAAEKLHSKRIYYTRNRHINPTNICVNRCRFCAFSRSRGQDGAYVLSIDEILEKLRVQSPEGLHEVHIVGGLHPDLGLDFHLDLVRAIKGEFPATHIKAFTAVEIDYFARTSGLALSSTLARLKTAGLDAMPGGGAEIFSPRVREILCPEKISGQRWLEVHRAAHALGIKTNATMLYGHVESFRERADHLIELRRLQDETGGFQAFIPLAYQPAEGCPPAHYPSGIDDLKTVAVSRLVLDNFPHVKAYWVMLGEKLSQTALLFGATDIDGTVVEEHIAHAANGSCITDSDAGVTASRLRYLIERAGKIPIERNALYEEVQK
jgi:aminodeoxyfutalosine synthase